MKKIFTAAVGIILAMILAVCCLAGCSSLSTETISIEANENSSESSTENSSDEASGSSGGSVTDSSSEGSSGDSSSSSSDNTTDSSSSNSTVTYTASGLDVDYNVTSSSTETHSTAENLSSTVTIYASSTVATTTSTHLPGMGSNSQSYTTYDREVYTGSGAIFSIDDDYVYVVTCYHVIYSETLEAVANEYICMYLYGSEYDVAKTTTQDTYGYTYDYGDTAIECEFIGGSWAEDVAVLRADKTAVYAINDSVQGVTFCEDYSAGDDVTAIGNYAGEGISVTKGNVAVESEEVELTLGSSTNNFRVMRLDINIYSGNSGCGLFDENGCYIGMINAISNVYTNYAFAIPASKVVKSIENIIYYANYKGMYTADLGIEVEAASSKYVYDSTTDSGYISESVKVTSVTGSSAAASMGLETDDIITAITVDGTTYTITRTFDVEDIQLIIFPDSVVTVTYTRSGTSATTSAYTFSSSDISQH